MKSPLEAAIEKMHTELAAKLSSNGTNSNVVVTQKKDHLVVNVRTHESGAINPRTHKAKLRYRLNSSGIALVLIDDKTYVSDEPEAILAILRSRAL